MESGHRVAYFHRHDVPETWRRSIVIDEWSMSCAAGVRLGLGDPEGEKE
jgi:hypothetical protein